MDFETELTYKLLGRAMPAKMRRQPLKRQLATKIVRTISSFLKEDKNHSLRPNQNYVHVFEMLELCERWKELPNFGEIDNHLMKKVMGYLLKICHFWWLDNLFILNRIAQHYHKCHGDFREVIYGVVDHNPTWKSLFTWGRWLVPTVHTDNLDTSPLTYFLIFYNRYSFVVHGRSFVDQSLVSGSMSLSPCEDCFVNTEPRKLLLLLQHGASICGAGFNNAMEHSYCFCLLQEMVSSLRIGENVDDSIPDGHQFAVSSDDAKRKLQCGRILVRVMPQVKKYREYSNNESTVNGLETLHRLGHFPDVVRRFKSPWELKHLCRLSVRYLVHYTRMGGLPLGLFDLGLPKQIVNYLNLLED